MVNIYNIKGKETKNINLPKIVRTQYRPDLIKRAFLTVRANKRQSYGANPRAGLRTSAHYHGRRRDRWAMIMRDLARLPRLHGTTPHLNFRVRRVPEAVKGRKAFPPKAEKIWKQKINKKENLLAIKSAIAATANKDLVKERGHRVEKLKDLPIILEDEFQSMKKTKDIEELLKNLGLENELKRVGIKKIRGTKGKMRGRKYKKKTGPLFIVTKSDGIEKSIKNIPGTNLSYLKDLDAELLAPGSVPGRLTIWSKSAIEQLDKVFSD